MLAPIHILFPFISGKISLYVTAFMLPIIRNFLSNSTSCATYSRKSEKGGLVTTMSASRSSSTHSGERKSPLPLRRVSTLLSFFISHSTSARFMAPSPLLSVTSVITILCGMPVRSRSGLSKAESCVPATGEPS